MSVSVVIAGTSYVFPQTGETNWGAQVTAWAQAVSVSLLQTSGGIFSLAADVNFGPSFGLISKYFKAGDGTVAAPSLTFANETSSGMYRAAAGDIGFSVLGTEVLDMQLSSPGLFPNVGIGNAASLSDLVPLSITRTNAAPIILQLSNPSSAAGSGSKLEVVSNAGASFGVIGMFAPATTTPDAYAGGRMTVRSSGTANGLSLIADNGGTSPNDVRIYSGGTTNASNLGLTVNQSLQTIFGGITLHTNGSATAPSVAFSNNTNSGLYSLTSADMSIAINGVQAMDFQPSSSGFGNVGIGGSASTNDQFPLLLQRTLANLLIVDISNTSANAANGSQLLLNADNANTTGQITQYSTGQTLDAYAGRFVFLPNNSSTGLTLHGGVSTPGDVRIYNGGFDSAHRNWQWNTDFSAQIMQAISTPASPSAGSIKLYQNASNGLSIVNSSGTVTTMLGKDANSNFSVNNLIEGYTTTATAAGTTALVVGSTYQQVFTGSTTQTVTLPVASGLVLGMQWTITNLSTGNVTVQSSGANTLQVMAQNTILVATCILASGTSTASWSWNYNQVGATGLPSTNPMTTGGDLIYGGAAGAPTRLANGTSGQHLQSAGTTSPPTWVTLPGNSTALKAPTIQSFTSTGSTTGYLFTVSSANATVGATYTNNGNTYTVLATIAAATSLFCSQASAPLASGTLTKASGTGDATITFSKNQPLATYTLPSGPSPLYLKIKMIGGGGGAAGSGTSNPTGAAGIGSVFGANLMTAGGGSPSTNALGAPGGTASLGTGPIGLAIAGGNAGTADQGTVTTNSASGGSGGNTPFFGGGGLATITAVTGGNGITNTGGGGGGAGTAAVANTAGSGGGGAGGFVDAIINAPSSTYVYAIGTGGAGGSAGASGAIGGNGAAGMIIVEEHYQ